MPDVNSIALGPWGQASSSGAGGGNPLGLASGMMGIMGDALKLRQGQAAFQARATAGGIIAGSPDLDTGIQRLLGNPDVAGYAPEIVNEMRQSQLALTQIRGLQAEQMRGVTGSVLHAAAGALDDPGQLQSILETQMKMLPPDLRARAMPAIQGLATSLTHDLDPDPAVAKQQYQKRLVGQLVGAGMKADEIYGAAGGTAPSTAVTYQPIGPGGSTVPVQTRTGGLGSTWSGGGAGGGAGEASVLPGVAGPTIAQKTGIEERTKQMVAYRGSLDNAVSDGTTLMATLQEGRDAMKTAASGGLSNARAGLGKLAQGLGASSETVNKITGGDLAATQEFQKLAPSMAMAQLRQQIPSGSRLNRQEWEAFEGANPNIDMDPHAIDKIFNFWTRIHVRNRIEQQQLGDYVRKGGDLNDWPEVWQDRAQNMGLAGPVFRSPSGVEVTPKDIDTLLKNPGAKEDFDTHYGKGAAESFLNLRGTGK